MKSRRTLLGCAWLLLLCFGCGGSQPTSDGPASETGDAAAHNAARDASDDAQRTQPPAVDAGEAGGDASASGTSDAGLSSASDASSSDASSSDASRDAEASLLCPGTAPLDAPAGATRCRTRADCASGYSCGPTYAAGGCGACFAATRECEDGTCPSGQVCLDMQRPCGCSSEFSSACSPRCTDTSCAADERCEESGKCVPRACDAGYACASDRVCDPTRIGADAHGCAVANCEEDGFECPAGFRCEPGLSAPSSDGCVPIHCAQGYTCGVNTECEAGSPYLHGCKPKSCEEDADCDCGVCINSACTAQLFVCSPPPPP